MKKAIFSLIIVLLALPLAAANANIDRANQAYKQELYNEALKLYLQEAEQTGVSSSLYCNIGDTYYRLKDNVHAVLYYERALLLDPSNNDARFNLEFVRGKMQLPDDAGDSWFSNWVDQTVSRLSPCDRHGKPPNWPICLPRSSTLLQRSRFCASARCP